MDGLVCGRERLGCWPMADATARRGERFNLTAEVGIRRSGVRPFRVHIFNASTEGCRIEFVEVPVVGERVWVKFDGLEALEGTVRWVDGHIGGVRFTTPIHNIIFQRLVAAAGNCPRAAFGPMQTQAP